MSTPITRITLFRTQFAQDNVVMDKATHTAYLNVLRDSAFTVENCTFQRQAREMRLPISMDIAGRYNYGEFVNNGRPFYCFITGMEYVNDNMTKASYVIDYWHTYQENITYHEVVVEREIIPKADDLFGKYVQDEPVEVNDWDTLFVWNTFNRDDGEDLTWNYLMVDNGTQSDPIAQPERYGNRYYAGVITSSFSLQTIVDRLADIVAENNTIESLQGLWALPTTDRVPFPYPNPTSFTYTYNFPANPNGVLLRNRKSFMSPYCFIGVFSSDGDYKAYNLQDIGDGSDTVRAWFDGNFSALPTPQMLLYPHYFKEFVNMGYVDAISCENFPTPNVATSNVTVSNQLSLTAKKWSLAAAYGMGVGNLLSSVGGMVSGGGGEGGGGLSISASPAQIGNAITTTSASVGNIAGATLSKRNQELHMKEICGVRGGGSAALWSLGAVGLTIIAFAPEANQLKAIDDFFSRYGYTLNMVKRPDISSRSKWNYTKTNGAEFAVANAPVEAENTINQMFDSGLTIWHTYIDFKDYTQENN